MNDYIKLSAYKTGLKGLCPRCGQGRLFAKFLIIAPKCSHCQLDLSKEDVGDGAIPLIILFASAIGVGVGAWLQLVMNTPMWVQFAVSFPIIIILVLATMQPLKGLMIALQFTHQSGDNDGDRL